MSEEAAAVDCEDAPKCRNCGADAPGAYCPACGQETQARMPAFVPFMREAAGRYVALDGRLWRTLVALLFRPGFLTREYFAGRRRRYIRPARLFLVASLLLFAALRVVAELAGDGYLVRFDPPAQDATRQEGAAAAKDSAPEKGSEHRGGLQIDDDLDVGLAAEIPALRARIERFNRLTTKEREAQITDGIFRYGPYAMFVLLPAFALLLKLVYLGRRRKYPARPRLYAEHIVFAAHNHAFLFLAIVAANLVSAGPLRFAVIAWMLVYLLWSMRVVYGGSWAGIVARSAVIAIVYTVLFALVTAGLVIVAVLLR